MSAPFRFKSFELKFDKTAMKPGTDALLLASFLNVKSNQATLDIGTGTGIIALLLAQRGFCPIQAIEPETKAFAQANENIKQSIYKHTIQLFNCDLEHFQTDTVFQNIVCNPPYHIGTASPQGNRNMARNADFFNITGLFHFCKNHLHPSGGLYLILPFSRKVEVTQLAQISGFSISKLCTVYGKEGKAANRILLEIKRGVHLTDSSKMVLRKQNDSWHEDYLKACKDFYHPDYFH